MRVTKSILVLCTISIWGISTSVLAQNDTTETPSRLTIGGYGEAVYSRHFYSDDVHRYMYPANYKYVSFGLTWRLGRTEMETQQTHGKKEPRKKGK